MASTPGPRVVFRCFPWDPDARPGAPFSPQFILPGQTVGRFDLHDRPPVRYLSETSEHAIGEALAPFRGTTFHPSYLRQSGHPLALVEATLAPALLRRLADLTDPSALAELRLKPDELAHHDRTWTQAIARRLHDLGRASGVPAGFRWWSALTGAWHTVVLFTDREQRGEVRFGTPRALTDADPAVVEAMRVVGVRRRT